MFVCRCPARQNSESRRIRSLTEPPSAPPKAGTSLGVGVALPPNPISSCLDCASPRVTPNPRPAQPFPDWEYHVIWAWRPLPALFGHFLLLSPTPTFFSPLPPILVHRVHLSFPTNHQTILPPKPLLPRPRSKTQAAESTCAYPPTSCSNPFSCSPWSHPPNNRLPVPIPYQLPPYGVHHGTRCPSLLPRLLKLSNLESLLFQPRSSPPFTLHPSRSLFILDIPLASPFCRGSLRDLCSDSSTIEQHHRFQRPPVSFLYNSPLVLIWAFQLLLSQPPTSESMTPLTATSS